MDKEQFRHIVWCDLEIVVLKIYSCSIWDTKRVLISHNPDITKPVVNVYICCEDDDIFNKPETYRENMMKNGLYLGHHFGLPAKLKFIDENNIAFYHQDPGKIIWCYIIKYVLTIYSYKENMLHIKGGAVAYKGKAFLILGRGGSGKTEMIKTLCRNGADFMANTHLLVNGKNVCGIKTNIRIRKSGEDIYFPITQFDKTRGYYGWLPIGGAFWINYRTDGVNLVHNIAYNCALSNIQYFSESIENWEMKEDLADYYNSDPFEFAEHINRTNALLHEFCKNQNIYYLNLDIFSDEGLKKAIDLMEEHIKG